MAVVVGAHAQPFALARADDVDERHGGLDEDPVGAAARRVALDAAAQIRELGVSPERSCEIYADAVQALPPISGD